MTIHRRASRLGYTICGEKIDIDPYRFLHSTQDRDKVTCDECKEKAIEILDYAGN